MLQLGDGITQCYSVLLRFIDSSTAYRKWSVQKIISSLYPYSKWQKQCFSSSVEQIRLNFLWNTVSDWVPKLQYRLSAINEVFLVKNCSIFQRLNGDLDWFDDFCSKAFVAVDTWGGKACVWSNESPGFDSAALFFYLHRRASCLNIGSNLKLFDLS